LIDWFKSTLRPPLADFLRKLPVDSRRLGPPKGVHPDTPALFRQKHPAYAAGEFIPLDPPRPFVQNCPSVALTAEQIPLFHRPFHLIRPETWVARIPGGRVQGKTVAVIGPDDHVLADVSVSWGSPSGHHASMDRFFLGPPRRLRGPAIVMATTGGDSYFHWLFDILPRLDFLRRAKIRAERMTWILNRPLNMFQAETLALLDALPEQIISLEENRHVQAEELIVPSLPDSIGDVSPQTVACLRKFFARQYRFAGRTPARIFLQRQIQASRQLANHEEVLVALAALDFVPVIPEQIPWVDQIRIFHNAEVVVGAHGGALANLAFARPGIFCVEFFSAHYLNKCFWGLTHQVKGRHAYAVCPSSQAGKTNRAAVSDLQIPAAALETISRLLSG